MTDALDAVGGSATAGATRYAWATGDRAGRRRTVIAPSARARTLKQLNS